MIDEAELTATFGPAPGDRATLSKHSRATLDALYRHPLAHNLEWRDVIALFGKLGTVEHQPNQAIRFSIGDEHHLLTKAHGKDVAPAEIMLFRHMLSRAGWSAEAAEALPIAAASSHSAKATDAIGPDLLLVVDHHEARLYRLGLAGTDPDQHTINPYDPHHFQHHLSHKDQSREQGQRTAEDQGFYAHLAHAIAPGRAIVVIGHGKGHSNAAQHLLAFLRTHHPQLFSRVVHQESADLSSVTAPQLLVLGRHALSA